MTKPDEALLWVRERAKGRMSSPNNPHRTIARHAEVDVGKHDAELSDEAHAYRAGQAASAERIKALEAQLAVIPSGKLCVCNAASDGNVPDREHKEADQ